MGKKKQEKCKRCGNGFIILRRPDKWSASLMLEKCSNCGERVVHKKRE